MLFMLITVFWNFDPRTEPVIIAAIDIAVNTMIGRKNLFLRYQEVLDRIIKNNIR